MTTTPTDAELKARHATMWALGDYPAVAREIIGGLGPRLVDACGVGPGMRVLDVAAGTGNVARAAAAAGAEVVASDLTPELVEAGRAEAAAAGVRLRWDVADAEHLPYDDDSFDVVTSCVGTMFAPHHRQTADELVRVCRPGGTIGLVNWTPDGFIGQMFGVMREFTPAPPPGVQPPPLWGDAEHVRSLLGPRMSALSLTEHVWDVEHLASAEAFLDYFKSHYGPTIAAYRGLSDDPGRTAELDRSLLDLADRFRDADGHFGWGYLLVLGTVA